LSESDESVEKLAEAVEKMLMLKPDGEAGSL